MRISDWSSDVCSSDLLVDVVRNAGALRSEKQDVAGGEREIGKRRRAGGGQQHETLRADLRPLPERVPSRLPPHIGAHGIIHSRALERGVAERKTAGFDDLHRRAETGRGEPDWANIPAQSR